MTDIVETVCNRLGASRATDSLCRSFLSDEGEQLCFGIWLEDPEVNYTLMTELDLFRLGKAARERAILSRRSPDECILIIFFREEGGDRVYFRTINGMVGRVSDILRDLLEQPQLFDEIPPYDITIPKAPPDPELPF